MRNLHTEVYQIHEQSIPYFSLNCDERLFFIFVQAFSNRHQDNVHLDNAKWFFHVNNKYWGIADMKV